MTGESLFSRSGPAGPEPTIDYKAELNPAQYQAVTTVDGPVLVVAGAGSGKTRTLVYRVAYLIEQGIPPESILLLTFTRKAAAEMLARAERLVGRRCAGVSGGTFHSLANEILRRWAPAIGYPNSFGVMDRGDMEDALGQLRKQAGMGEGDRRFPKKSTLAEIISKRANKSVALQELLAEEYPHLLAYFEDIKKLAGEYSAYKLQNALVDFDDLLVLLAGLLRDNEDARRKIASAYQYVMVDEYQDTNLVQAEIVRLLGRDHGNVMAVGDDAQSIYSFRGASFKNIMEFPAQFSGTSVIRLEENYRSRQPILNLTNHIISRAREKYDKNLFTRREGGLYPNVRMVATEKEQSLFVCRRIRELIAEGIEPSDIAVLFRAASHSFDLEVELMRHSLEFVKYGGRKFLEAAHIKDLLALLRVSANPSDGVSLNRALLLMDGVGPRTAMRIIDWTGGSREKVVSLKDYPGQGKYKESLAPLAALLAEIAGKGVGIQDRVAKAWDFYRPILESRYDDHPKRTGDIKELLRLAKNYTSMVRFLTDMTLEPPNTSTSRPDREQDAQRVVLSTVHSAKGLEWKAVFIIWAAEGRFPASYAIRTPAEVDEERRLMYVAATRAEDYLYIICPLESDGWSNAGMPPRLSRFVEDVPPDLVTLEGAAAPAAPEPPGSLVIPETPPPRPSFGKPSAAGPAGDFSPGDRVSHPIFGLGRVINLPGGRKIKIDFDHFGLKTLHLDYAGLTKAGY